MGQLPGRVVVLDGSNGESTEGEGVESGEPSGTKRGLSAQRQPMSYEIVERGPLASRSHPLAREVAASNEVQLLLSAAERSQAVIPEIAEIQQNRELVEENTELDGRRDGSAVEPAAEGGRGAHEDCHGSGTLLNDVEDLALLKDAGLFQPMQGRIAPANITPAQPPPQHERKEEMIPPEVANYDSYDPTMLVRPHTIAATRSWRPSPKIISAMSP